MTVRTIRRLAVIAGALLLAACAGGEAPEREHEDAEHEAAEHAENGLTAEQMEKGIGPIRDVDLGSLDAALAARGAEIFTLKCSACHKPDERYVGPALAGVTERRAPEYVMNMILNPEQMVAQHPEARKLLGEFMLQMPNQNLTQDEARAVLEYLRSLTAGSTQSTESGNE